MAHFYREAQYDCKDLNEANRTVPIAFSSETPVKCVKRTKRAGYEDEEEEYDEILDHSERGINMSRAKDGLPLMLSHRDNDAKEQVGIVENIVLGEDKVMRGVARFGAGELADNIFADVKAGIRKSVSVGYERTSILETKVAGGRKAVRFGWMPVSVSVVPVPADTAVGFGRSEESGARNMGGDVATASCNQALYACRDMIKTIDACEKAEDAKHAKARGACSEAVLGSLSVYVDASNWANATAAQVVDTCERTADACVEASSAVRALAVCQHCAAQAIVTAEECDEAAEACLTNAGKKPNIEERTMKLRNLLLNPDAPAGGGGMTPEQVTVRENEAAKRERQRCKEIKAAVTVLCEKHPDGAEKFRSLETEALDNGTSAADFKATLLEAIPGTRKANPITPTNLGMSERDVKRYSLMRAVQGQIRGRGLDGLEREVHDEMCKRNIGFSPDGFWVPPQLLVETRASRSMVRAAQRDLNVSNATQGGNFVQTTIFTPIIELLRNRMVTDRLGVQVLSGLEGNVAIPRQTGAATAYAVTETATLTKSMQAIDQILLNPKRVGAWNDYSKQLLLQSSVDVENFMRDDLMKVLAIKHDKIILEGQGGNNEPTGIMNTTGIGSVAFGNATPTWAKMIAFETSLSVANADAGNMAYVTTPTVRGSLKAVAKIGTTFPVFIWEKGAWNDGSNDGEINGYRAAATNQIADNRVAFGNWEDCILALWGGYDVVVNPFTRDTDGVVRITVNTFCDVAVRHAASFCWSADPGNV